MEKTMDEIMQALHAPFPAKRVRWKPQATSRDKKSALAVPYIDARDVAQRLDEAVGAFNWACDHKVASGQLLTGIGICNPETGDWVWKWDTGLVTADEGDDAAMAAKGTISDGLKRAAVLWGVFRYAYSLPKVWVPFDPQKKKLLEVPELPDWALPEEERGRSCPGRSSPRRAGPGGGNGNPRPQRGSKAHRPDSSSESNPRKRGEEPAAGDLAAGYLQVTAPIGTKTHPEFRGQTLEALLKTPEGRQFVGYLAARYRPHDSGRQAVVAAAQALVEAGLTR